MSRRQIVGGFFLGGLGLMAAMRREADVSPSLKMVEAAVADYRKGDTRQAVKSVLHDLRSRLPAAPPFTQEDFKRVDERPDAQFYSQPRFVYHIDEAAMRSLTRYYKATIPAGADVLDLCSSWVSHYPTDLPMGRVVGVGMNDAELRRNPQLSSFVVQDLNRETKLPFDDASFDVVTLVVSIDYLVQPIQVLREAGRVLRPEGLIILSQSNRCFPTKIFRLWRDTDDLQHIALIGAFLHYADRFGPAEAEEITESRASDPMYVVRAKATGNRADL